MVDIPPLVLPGQTVKASTINALIEAVRRSRLLPSSSIAVSQSPRGTVIDLRQSNRTSANAFKSDYPYRIDVDSDMGIWVYLPKGCFQQSMFYSAVGTYVNVNLSKNPKHSTKEDWYYVGKLTSASSRIYARYALSANLQDYFYVSQDNTSYYPGFCIGELVKNNKNEVSIRQLVNYNVIIDTRTSSGGGGGTGGTTVFVSDQREDKDVPGVVSFVEGNGTVANPYQFAAKDLLGMDKVGGVIDRDVFTLLDYCAGDVELYDEGGNPLGINLNSENFVDDWLENEDNTTRTVSGASSGVSGLLELIGSATGASRFDHKHKMSELRSESGEELTGQDIIDWLSGCGVISSGAEGVTGLLLFTGVVGTGKEYLKPDSDNPDIGTGAAGLALLGHIHPLNTYTFSLTGGSGSGTGGTGGTGATGEEWRTGRFLTSEVKSLGTPQLDDASGISGYTGNTVGVDKVYARFDHTHLLDTRNIFGLGAALFGEEVVEPESVNDDVALRGIANAFVYTEKSEESGASGFTGNVCAYVYDKYVTDLTVDSDDLLARFGYNDEKEMSYLTHTSGGVRYSELVEIVKAGIFGYGSGSTEGKATSYKLDYSKIGMSGSSGASADVMIGFKKGSSTPELMPIPDEKTGNPYFTFTDETSEFDDGCVGFDGGEGTILNPYRFGAKDYWNGKRIIFDNVKLDDYLNGKKGLDEQYNINTSNFSTQCLENLVSHREFPATTDVYEMLGDATGAARYDHKHLLSELRNESGGELSGEDIEKWLSGKSVNDNFKVYYPNILMKSATGQEKPMVIGFQSGSTGASLMEIAVVGSSESGAGHDPNKAVGFNEEGKLVDKFFIDDNQLGSGNSIAAGNHTHGFITRDGRLSGSVVTGSFLSTIDASGCIGMADLSWEGYEVGELSDADMFSVLGGCLWDVIEDSETETQVGLINCHNIADSDESSGDSIAWFDMTTDGYTRLVASDVSDLRYSELKQIKKAGIFEYTGNGGTASSFQLNYKNLGISTGESEPIKRSVIGFHAHSRQPVLIPFDDEGGGTKDQTKALGYNASGSIEAKFSIGNKQDGSDSIASGKHNHGRITRSGKVSGNASGQKNNYLFIDNEGYVDVDETRISFSSVEYGDKDILDALILSLEDIAYYGIETKRSAFIKAGRVSVGKNAATGGGVAVFTQDASSKHGVLSYADKLNYDKIGSKTAPSYDKAIGVLKGATGASLIDIVVITGNFNTTSALGFDNNHRITPKFSIGDNQDGTNSIAAGNHTHGSITRDGKIQNSKEGMFLYADAQGYVKCQTKELIAGCSDDDVFSALASTIGDIDDDGFGYLKADSIFDDNCTSDDCIAIFGLDNDSRAILKHSDTKNVRFSQLKQICAHGTFKPNGQGVAQDYHLDYSAIYLPGDKKTSPKAIGFGTGSTGASLLDIAVLANKNDTTLAPVADNSSGASQRIGTKEYAARADHIHPLNVSTSTGKVKPVTTVSGGASLGTEKEYARVDHVHELKGTTGAPYTFRGRVVVGTTEKGKYDIGYGDISYTGYVSEQNPLTYYGESTIPNSWTRGITKTVDNPNILCGFKLKVITDVRKAENQETVIGFWREITVDSNGCITNVSTETKSSNFRAIFSSYD